MSKINKVLMFKEFQKENKLSQRFWVNNHVCTMFFADTVLQKNSNLMCNIDHCSRQTLV